MTKVTGRTATKTTTAATTDVQGRELAEGQVLNKAGGAAYKADDYDALVSYLRTGGVGNTYYASKGETVAEATELMRGFALRDPQFLAQAAIDARQNGFMRAMPIRALVVLSTSAREDKRYFHAAWDRIILTPGDLADFWTLLRGEGKLRGVGRAVREATGRTFAKMSAYHAIKYGAESQKMSLRDILRMSRATAGLSGEQDALVHWLVKGEVTDAAPSQLRGYVEFKNASASIDALLEMVATYRLPWEVVAPQVGDGDARERKKVWTALAKQMPYMALLRNLNNLIKYGVLDDGAVLVGVCTKLSNSDNVLNSKQFPFRFMSAIRAVEASAPYGNARTEVVAALTKALDISVLNMPLVGKKVLTVLDVSGSMSAPVNGRAHSAGGFYNTAYEKKGDDIACVDVGAAFAAAFYKASGGDVMTFDTEAKWETKGLSQDMSVLQIASRINHKGGGTSLWVPLKEAFMSPVKYDAMVFVTDSMSWNEELSSTNPGSNGFYGRMKGENTSSAMLRQYQANVNPDVQTFFVQLVPTSTRVMAPSLPGVHFVYGWSQDVPRYIGATATGGAGLLDSIKAIEL